MLENIDIAKICTIAKEAGKVIMEIYEQDFKIEYKDDNSPLTEADTSANKLICEQLKQNYPNIPMMSEENKEIAYEDRKDWEYYWCIDPIDGTKEFIRKNGEFTVNIALIYNNKPVLGVVYAPAMDEIYYAKENEGAYKNGEKLPLQINNNPQEKLTVVASKSHLSEETQSFIDKLDTKKIEQVSKGSSLKLCMVAEGIADIYPRLAPTMEWDTAAADAIVRESGKMTYQFLALNADTPSSKEQMGCDLEDPVIYNKENLLNPWFVVR